MKMADRKFKKAIVFALILTMLMPLGSTAASSTEDEAAAAETTDTAAASEEASDDSGEAEEKPSKEDKNKLPEKITDEQAVALDTCEKAAENDKFILYFDGKNDRWGCCVKESKNYWWSSPINAGSEDIPMDENGSLMKSAKQTLSSLQTHQRFPLPNSHLLQQSLTELSECTSSIQYRL